MRAKFKDVPIGDPKDGVIEVLTGDMQFGAKPTHIATGPNQQGMVLCWRETIQVQAWSICQTPIERMGHIEVLLAAFGSGPGTLRVIDDGRNKAWHNMTLIAIKPSAACGPFIQFTAVFTTEHEV